MSFLGKLVGSILGVPKAPPAPEPPKPMPQPDDKAIEAERARKLPVVR